MILLDPDARPIVAHRGASCRFPENTLLAFDAALEEGADALELDVRGTADGAVVVMHDATVDRTTDGTGAVRALTLEALRELDAGRGERVPTLTAVLERYAGMPLILEVKEAEVAAAAAALLRRHGAANRVLVGSFVPAALAPFRRREYHRSASRRETAAAWLLSRAGVPVPGAGFAGFAVPERHGRLTVVDAAFVRAARRWGRPVHVWTVDDVATARRLRRIGVAGIITNDPARMRELSASR